MKSTVIAKSRLIARAAGSRKDAQSLLIVAG